MREQEPIHEKGFNIQYNMQPQTQEEIVDYNKIRVGVKTLTDATYNLGSIKKVNQKLCNKGELLKALRDKDLNKLRLYSDYFFRQSGIYQKACEYLATTFRYDWYVVPEIYSNAAKTETVLKEFAKVLNYLDNSYIKKMCTDISLKVIKNGCYYGYVVAGQDSVVLQELPIKYCRTRYSVGNNPAVEFNMKYFDEQFSDVGYRLRIIKMFPDEFAKGYMLYKQNKLQPDFSGDNQGSWYLLEPKNTVKFNLNNGDLPYLINAIPAIIDLDAAQDLDRQKQMQKLLKILVQKLPTDKNGDLIFDIDEARDLHNNAIEMLSRAIGVDVLTTFADIQSIDISDKNTTTTKDDLQKVERTVYNDMGISQNIFNAEGNLSLNNSLLQDEGTIRVLPMQFEIFYDRMVQQFSKNPKKYKFRLYMLGTTQYNYKDLSKLYKEQVQIGYSKMLPQIALGHSQSAIINTAYFENEILDLQELMIPPLMSSTMRGEDLINLGGKHKSNQNNSQNNQETGRPEKDDAEKSDKTIANRESIG